jgi:hypothetical protein
MVLHGHACSNVHTKSLHFAHMHMHGHASLLRKTVPRQPALATTPMVRNRRGQLAMSGSRGITGRIPVQPLWRRSRRTIFLANIGMHVPVHAKTMHPEHLHMTVHPLPKDRLANPHPCKATTPIVRNSLRSCSFAGSPRPDQPLYGEDPDERCSWPISLATGLTLPQSNLVAVPRRHRNWLWL